MKIWGECARQRAQLRAELQGRRAVLGDSSAVWLEGRGRGEAGDRVRRQARQGRGAGLGAGSAVTAGAPRPTGGFRRGSERTSIVCCCWEDGGRAEMETGDQLKTRQDPRRSWD